MHFHTFSSTSDSESGQVEHVQSNILTQVDSVFGRAKAQLELFFTDLLKVASLQGLVSHLAEIHVSVVVAQFPLQHTEKRQSQPGETDFYVCPERVRSCTGDTPRSKTLIPLANGGHSGWSSRRLGPVLG